MITKGKFDWYSPQKALRPEAAGVLNRLATLKDLPHVPHVALEIQQLLTDPDIAPKALAAKLKEEPVLATQLMQIAENLRNARHPGNPPIKSLEHAIVYVGLKQLADVILTSALRSIPLPPSDFSPDTFWREAYLTGAVAERIVTRYKLPLNPDEVFLAASLCNLGKLVTAFCFGALTSRMLHETEGAQGNMSWRKAEVALSFPDHTILGEIAATLWGFPEYIVSAALRHHEPPAKDGPLGIRDVVAFANQMVHWILLRPHRMEYEIVEATAKRLGLSENDLEALAADLTPLRATG
jgi:HD-like signal output (HDOD) protein